MKTLKTILITGAAGFLGSHLAERLADGNRLVLLDNLQTGNMHNISCLLKNKNVTFVKSDVKDSLPQDNFDEIWNLACAASPVHYQAQPIDTLLTNVLGMKNVLDLAVKTGAKVFQASTSEVYGDPQVHPQNESYQGNVNPIGIRACYDEGKRAAETLCYDYNRVYGVDVRLARIFNTYGPRMDAKDGRVVSNFIVNALHHAPLELYGEGTQTRSFCYVDDLLDGFQALMALPQMPLTPINIGNPHEFSVKELAETVISLTQSRSSFVIKPLPKDDPLLRRPDITKAKAAFGFAPKVQLIEGLTKTIAYFKGGV